MKYHTMQFRIGNQLVPCKLPYSDAKKVVVLERDDIDAFNGKEGHSGECMNAQCALRWSSRFPHPVHLVEFTDVRAWVVDRVNSKKWPSHCVKYIHNEGKDQKLFDEPGGKRRMVKSGLVAKEVKLYPPRKRHNNKHTSGHPHKETGNQTNPALHRGSWARAQRAGLIDIDTRAK